MKKRTYTTEQMRRKLAKQKQWRDENADRVRELGRAASKRWRAANPRRALESRLRVNYGIALADYDALRALQDGRCAVCAAEKTLVVDHDHATGKVRGLLCHGCNVGIGLLGDSASAVSRAVQYLEG